jgi:hypothetical protein
MYSPENREKLLKEKNPLYITISSNSELFIGQVRKKKNQPPVKEGLALSKAHKGEIFHGIFKNGLRSHVGFLK